MASSSDDDGLSGCRDQEEELPKEWPQPAETMAISGYRDKVGPRITPAAMSSSHGDARLSRCLDQEGPRIIPAAMVSSHHDDGIKLVL